MSQHNLKETKNDSLLSVFNCNTSSRIQRPLHTTIETLTQNSRHYVIHQKPHDIQKTIKRKSRWPEPSESTQAHLNPNATHTFDHCHFFSKHTNECIYFKTLLFKGLYINFYILLSKLSFKLAYIPRKKYKFLVSL